MGTLDTLLRVKADASAAVRGLAPLQASLQETAVDAGKTEAALDALGGQHKVSLNTQAIATARTEIDRLRDEMAKQLLIDPKADVRDAQRQISQLQKSIKTLDAETPVVTVEVEAETTGVGSLKDEIAGVTTAAAGLGGAIGAWKLVGLAADVETTKISLSALTGSAEEGAAAFADLQKFAATTPFELDQVTSAAKSLLAAGIDANQLPDMLTDIGNAASAVNAPLDETSQILGQMFLKGQVSNEELLQLTERGIPAFTALADAMGVSVAELQDLASAGELGADKIEMLIQALGDRTPTAMADQAASLNGQLSTLSDNVSQLGSNLGTILLPPSKRFVGTINGALGPLASFVGKFQELPKPVQDTAGQFVVLSGVVSSAAFFGPRVIGVITAATSALSNLGTMATVTSGRLKALGAGFTVAAVIIGIQQLDKALGDLFNTTLNADHLDRELTNLAVTGEASGEFAKTFGGDLEGIGKQISTLTSTIPQLTDAVFGIFPGQTSVEEFSGNITKIDDALATMVDSGDAETAAKVMALITQAAEEQGVSVEDVAKQFPQYQTALENAAGAAKEEAAATQDSANAHWDTADAVAEHADRMEDLADRVDTTKQRYEDLRDAFTSFNDDMIASRSAVSNYESDIDDLAESLVKGGGVFDLDLEAGRTNFDNLAGLAEDASVRVEGAFEKGGVNAAVKMQKGFRQGAHQMLIDAGVGSDRAWQLVNQTFDTPVEVRLELGKIDDADLRAEKARLLKQKALLLEPVIGAISPRAADELSIDAQKKIKPIDARIKVINEDLKGPKGELDDAANPKGKPRKAHINAQVDQTSVNAADLVLDTLVSARTAKIFVDVVGGAPPAGPTAGPSAGPTAAPRGLVGASTAMLSSPTPSATGTSGFVGRGGAARGVQPEHTVTRLAPKQTPVAVYLDGVEIAHRIEARRALAATTSVRRSA